MDIARLDLGGGGSALYLSMTDFTFPFPALVCDTGGTNVRFALVSEPGARLSDIVHLRTGDYSGLAEAIEAAVPKLGDEASHGDCLRRRPRCRGERSSSPTRRG